MNKINVVSTETSDQWTDEVLVSEFFETTAIISAFRVSEFNYLFQNNYNKLFFIVLERDIWETYSKFSIKTRVLNFPLLEVQGLSRLLRYP
jgi:hypothetical protein